MSEQRVESVERALKLLDCFDEQHGEYTLTELARATGYYKSTILRLMGSLERFGYVSRDERGVYRLGITLARLGALANPHEATLEEVIRPILVLLRDQSQETASFYVREGHERVCLFRENGRHEVRHHLEEGARLPLEIGAAGRVLTHTEEPQAFISRGERSPQLAAVAVPVHDSKGRMRGALALSGIKDRFDDNTVQQYITLLYQQAERLHHHLAVIREAPANMENHVSDKLSNRGYHSAQ